MIESVSVIMSLVSNVSNEPILNQITVLERAAQRAQVLATKLDYEIGRVATLRFFAFLIGASCTFAGWYDQAWTFYLVPAVLGWLVFIFAMWKHKRLYALAPRASLTAQVHRESIARVCHDWSKLNEGGECYLSGKPYERELQIFGEVSLYKLINATQLAGSRLRLAQLLQGRLLDDPPLWEEENNPIDLIHLRQEAAQELAHKRALRTQVAVEAQVGSKRRTDLAPLIRWAEAGSPLPSHWTWKSKLGQFLVVSTWIQICLEISFELNTLWQFTLLAQLILYMMTTKTLSSHYRSLLGEHHKALQGLSRCYQRLEKAKFQSKALQCWQKNLTQEGVPSIQIKELSKIAEALAVRHSALLYGVLAIGFCWELNYGVKAWRWRANYGKRVRRDLELLYDWEALASMGAFWADHGQRSWPKLHESSEGTVLTTQQLTHPLFDPNTRRANDFQLKLLTQGGNFVLITGSNMSGKSSFMRSIGTNACLAFAGAPVIAREMTLTPLELSTSIQITDDPSQGWSRFYAEVRRIRDLIKEAEAASASRPVLYLIDEMLSGTNSRERRFASRAIASRLLASPHAAGIITTHDLDLAQLEDSFPSQIRCAHFSDVFDGKRLLFDYQLKEGVATTTNALRVLWLEGIDVPELQEEEGVLNPSEHDIS